MVHTAPDLLEQLMASPRITAITLVSSPTEQGIYVLWLESDLPTCLKVGTAGPRRGKGLRERLGFHFSGNEATSVLSRHLAADRKSPWTSKYDLTSRHDRKRFLAEQCYFQAIELPGRERTELLALEKHLKEILSPLYADRVGKDHS